MSDSAEKMKSLLAFKKKIETRIEELESESEDLKATLEILDTILLEKGFKRPEINAKPTPTAGVMSQDETISSKVVAQTENESQIVTLLKSDSGEVLADFYVDSTDGSLRVKFAKDKDFDIKTPPFNQFLIQRVLLKMQERDSELARAGQLPPEKILCFDIVRDGDKIQELVVRNFDDDRLRELKSSIRWTLEKMFEKTKAEDQ
jgi:hypothetical protein